MRLGAPVFIETTDPDLLVREHQRLGLTAAYCPVLEDAVLRKDTRQAFAEADIVLAEVGAYGINILDTDAAQRVKNIDTLCRLLAYAEEMGALCCVMHGGTSQAGGWGASCAENISAASFNMNVAGIQQIIDTVRPQHAKLTVEMTAWTFPYNMQTYLDLLSAVDRPEFAVHLDPVNILDSPVACYRNTEILRACFRQLGPHIISCHAKDVLLKGVYLPIEITETLAGQGMLNYRVYLEVLAGLTRNLPLMIEHLSAEELPPSIAYIQHVALEVGVAFYQSAGSKEGKL